MHVGRLFRTSWRDLRAFRRQDLAYKQIWTAFGYYPATADGRHDTEEWQDAPGAFAICLIRVPAGLLQPSLDALRAALEPFDSVRMHPDHFLHITLQELGFICESPQRSEEITDARVEEFVTGASTALASAVPFDLRLGGANSFQDAPFLDVHDRGQCSRMHARLRELAAVPTQPRYAYVPHMTVGHYTGEAPTQPLQEALSILRDRRFGSFTVHEVEVVTLSLGGPYPELVPVATIPLGG